VFLELFPSSSRAQRHWKVDEKKGLTYIYRRHSAGGWHKETASGNLCDGGALCWPLVLCPFMLAVRLSHPPACYLSWRAIKPTASTDSSPGDLLSQPPAHLSEYLWSECVWLNYSLTHSLPTLAAAASNRNRPYTPPPPLLSFALAPPPQPPSANCRPTLQPPVPRPTSSSRFTTVAWRAAPSRPTIANLCLSPCWSARRVASS
jgi:hypothetical protein